MEVLYSVKSFNFEFSHDLYVLRSPEFKKLFFENCSARMYACCVCDCVGNIQRFIPPKLIEIETPNFYTQYQIIFPDFGENRKTGNGRANWK